MTLSRALASRAKFVSSEAGSLAAAEDRCKKIQLQPYPSLPLSSSPDNANNARLFTSARARARAA